jgi:hypothetical protein
MIEDKDKRLGPFKAVLKRASYVSIEDLHNLKKDKEDDFNIKLDRYIETVTEDRFVDSVELTVIWYLAVSVKTFVAGGHDEVTIFPEIESVNGHIIYEDVIAEDLVDMLNTPESERETAEFKYNLKTDDTWKFDYEWWDKSMVDVSDDISPTGATINIEEKKITIDFYHK